MTHDELLAEIDSRKLHPAQDITNRKTWEHKAKLYDALRAVVELHKNHGECGMPTWKGTYPCPATNTCHECGTNVGWPCPTVKAIEAGLAND